MARQAGGQRRVEHREVGGDGAGVNREFGPTLDRDDRDWRRFGAGAGGGRDEDQRQFLPLRHLDPPDRVEIIARTEQISGELGDIHRASAAEPDDRVGGGRAPHFDRGEEGRLRRIGLDRAEQGDRMGLFEFSDPRSGKTKVNQLVVGDEQQWPVGKQGGKLGRAGRGSEHAGTVGEGEGLHRQQPNASGAAIPDQVAFEPAHQRPRRALHRLVVELAFVEPLDPRIEIAAGDDQPLRRGWHLLDHLGVAGRGVAQPALGAAALDLVQFAGLDRALGQQPGDNMHDPRGDLERLASEADPNERLEQQPVALADIVEIGARLVGEEHRLNI